mgnify:CR=1 FL=1
MTEQHEGLQHHITPRDQEEITPNERELSTPYKKRDFPFAQFHNNGADQKSSLQQILESGLFASALAKTPRGR